MSPVDGSPAPRRSTRPTRKRLQAVLALVVAALTAVATTAGAVPEDGVTGESAPPDPAAPNVVPALSNWAAQDGEYQFGSGSRVLYPAETPELNQVARTLAQDLEAEHGMAVPVVPSTESQRAGDVVLELDSDREDLGQEGYEMVVDDVVRVTGHRDGGAFYGTRTLLQLLTQDLSVAKGKTVDEPRYPERGTAVCPCEIKISMPRMERLMREMSYVKLNYMLLPLKMESDSHPEANKWSYYTKEEARQIAEMAEKYHIMVIPEINAPGHMEPFLFDRPDLQLKDANGEGTSRRIDITKPEVFDFYTDLVDEYLEIFPSPYWHMGADEYMLHSAYENYPQIGEYAQEKFGPDAVPADAFIDFVNRVNDYVRDEHDKTLRIWNDGLPRENILPSEQGPHPRVDTNIMIHHWVGSYVEPKEFLDAGYTLNNSADSLYEDRGGKLALHDMCPDAHRLADCVPILWDEEWSPGRFEGGGQVDPDHPGLTGAQISLWQTDPDADTEAQMEDALFMPLRFLGQRTWGGAEQFVSYEEFTDRAQLLGDPPGWNNVEYRPLSDGTYTIHGSGGEDNGALAAKNDSPDSELVVGESAEQWQLKHTDDGYYRIVSAETGRCVEMALAEGLALLEGEPGVGEAATMQPCTDSNVQKWEITADGDAGYTVTNAISQMVTTVDSDDTVVQMPPDQVSASTWTFELDAEATVSVEPSDELLEPGDENDVAVSLSNHGDDPMADLDLTLRAPDGWQVEPEADESLGDVEPGDTVTTDFVVVPPEDASHTADFRLSVDAAYTVGSEPGEVSGATPVHVDPIVCSDSESQPTDPNDEFDGTELDGCRWTEVRDPDPATLEVGDGLLQIETHEGDLAGGEPNGIDNLVLQDAPAGDWTAEIKMDAPLSEEFHQAGVMVHGDDDNFVQFVLVADNPPGETPNLYYSLVSERDGEFGSGGEVHDTDVAGDSDDVWWLRLAKHGTTYTAEYSPDGESWTSMPGEVVNDGIDDPDVGLFATYPGITVGFDYFHLAPRQ